METNNPEIKKSSSPNSKSKEKAKKIAFKILLPTVEIMSLSAANAGCVSHIENKPIVSTIDKPTDYGLTTFVETAMSESELSWNKLSPEVRIDKLELKKYPEYKNFDLNQELVKATCQAYSQKIPSKFTPEQMIQRIELIPTSDLFLKRYSEETEGNSTEAQKKQFTEASPGITIHKGSSNIQDRKILINLQIFDAYTKMIRDNFSPQSLAIVKDRNLKTIVLKSIIRHELGHLHESSRTFALPKITIEAKEGMFLPKQINGLDLILENLSTNTTFGFSTISEGMTELASPLSTANTQEVFIPNPAYNSIANLLNELNRISGIKTSEFLDYYLGNTSIEGLLKKWGSIKNQKNPDINSAIRIYFFASLLANSNNSEETIYQTVEKEIGKPIPRP